MSDAPHAAQPGELTTLLAGREISAIHRNGVSLLLTCRDGFEVQIAWGDPATKQLAEGVPVIVRAGMVKPAQRLPVLASMADLRKQLAAR